MIAARYSLIALLLWLTPGWAVGKSVSYVSSRDVLVGFSPGNGAQVETIRLWVSRDGGQSWQAETPKRVSERTLRHTVPEDGWYGFYVVLENAAGSSAEPPTSGSEPHVRVVVDTVAPTLQLHAGSSQMKVAGGETLTVRLSLIDENQGEAGARVFYRTCEEGSWTDGGLARLRESELKWRVPEVLAGCVDLRLVATDLAGNRSSDELRGVQIDSPSHGLTAKPSVVVDDAAADTPDVDAAATELSGPIDPTSVEPALARMPTAVEQKELAHLRRLARRYLAERRYPLAAERLRSALVLSPNDADLMVDLGSVLYRSGQFDQADARFGAALEMAPDHTGALEGLALVAATQKRYSHASTHLEQLLRLRPESAGTWLRYGDIQHKLGNKAEALKAWNRVMGLDEPEKAVRVEAEKRLKYFGPQRRTQP